MSNYGILKGEQCGRDGCNGIIDEHDTDKRCCCHINPPCSYCTDDRHYCPVCDWSGRDEQIERQEKARVKNSSAQDFYNHMMDKQDARNQRIIDMMSGKIPIDSLQYICKGHTHFSMIKEGVYPPYMSKEQLLKEIKGTFGGRFERYGNGRFKYIAYTD